MAAVLFGAVVGMVGGCGPGGDRLPTAKVSGKVTYAGKPVSQGTIMFVPDGTGPAASGELSQDGSYALQTYDPGDGAVPGKYRVSITAIEATGEALPETPALPKMLIPEKYNSHISSGLTFDVAEGKDNVADFDLKK